MSVSIFLSLTMDIDRKNIFPRVTLFGWWQVWKYLLLSCPISLVNKNDPGLMGPDAYIFWRQFLRKRVQNCDHKITESDYFFGMRRDVNKLLEPCFHIHLRFHTWGRNASWLQPASEMHFISETTGPMQAACPHDRIIWNRGFSPNAPQQSAGLTTEIPDVREV